MEDKKIGMILKSERNRAGFSAEEVSSFLREKGHKATPSTVYNWENDISQPKPGALLAMCQLYGIEDVLTTFGYDRTDNDTFIPTAKETELIKKYRVLDSYGVRAVESVINIEHDRCISSASRVSESVRAIRYYQRVASAGSGQVLFDGMPVEQIVIPDTDEYRRVAYAVGVNGDSMEPMLEDGDILLVEPTTDIRIGEIGIFFVDGNSYVKKLGYGELLSLNEKYGPIRLDAESRCMGRVVDKL